MLNKFQVVAALFLSITFAGCGSKTTSNDTQATDTAKIAASKPTKSILVFGDSLTAGYGLDDPSEAYPGILQTKIDSAKLPYTIINGGLSGETSAGGKGRINWLLKQHIDIFVLELGANDGLRGIPVKETEQNLQTIIDRVKAKYPKAKMVMLGMQVPPNMGATYASDFKNMFPKLATKNNMALVPFLLQGVGGVRALNQKDGIHPTAAGDKILANNVWEVIKGIL
ncbi:arylesterase [Mucilaginibacter phyllosphaerae]|uniref:Acyl-CoA thioesterase-1 n=1 Tax=Mucilaginibacter phyllosphaerae TaxID=1812349 RepID=A0A4Y8ACG3_9SPHI|nr:arylesterase [Mucilaginibacter phyllosphaerae]MBB3969061.1 acyl-CoA thioesterase-1 [Mucilaginibacter phyllosphaerae]TEW66120.1 arylesterase [Mucilaginibacter phyllosphaerae]GGH06003.1 arylesterase [Mucilaginibacter phyllosphaerae]